MANLADTKSATSWVAKFVLTLEVMKFENLVPITISNVRRKQKNFSKVVNQVFSL